MVELDAQRISRARLELQIQGKSMNDRQEQAKKLYEDVEKLRSMVIDYRTKYEIPSDPEVEAWYEQVEEWREFLSAEMRAEV